MAGGGNNAQATTLPRTKLDLRTSDRTVVGKEKQALPGVEVKPTICVQDFLSSFMYSNSIVRPLQGQSAFLFLPPL